MADLNIRNFPDDLLRRLKREAAEREQTLRELCIQMLSENVPEDWSPAQLRGSR